MKVTPELERILHRARAPNQLSTSLEKEQLFGVDDVALVCTKEDLLDETFIAPAKAAGVPCDSLAEKVCIKKVWALCIEAFEKTTRADVCEAKFICIAIAAEVRNSVLYNNFCARIRSR